MVKKFFCPRLKMTDLRVFSQYADQATEWTTGVLFLSAIHFSFHHCSESPTQIPARTGGGEPFPEIKADGAQGLQLTFI
jgi:hypothetical protein